MHFMEQRAAEFSFLLGPVAAAFSVARHPERRAGGNGENQMAAKRKKDSERLKLQMPEAADADGGAKSGSNGKAAAGDGRQHAEIVAEAVPAALAHPRR